MRLDEKRGEEGRRGAPKRKPKLALLTSTPRLKLWRRRGGREKWKKGRGEITLARVRLQARVRRGEIQQTFTAQPQGLNKRKSRAIYLAKFGEPVLWNRALPKACGGRSPTMLSFFFLSGGGSVCCLLPFLKGRLDNERRRGGEGVCRPDDDGQVILLIKSIRCSLSQSLSLLPEAMQQQTLLPSLFAQSREERRKTAILLYTE